MYETNLNIIRFQAAYPQTTSWSKLSGNFGNILNLAQEQSQSQIAAKVSASISLSASSTADSASSTDTSGLPAENTLATLIFEVLSEFLNSRKNTAPEDGSSVEQSTSQGRHSRTQPADEEGTAQKSSSSEYVFYRGYFTALQELVQQELLKGHDPEVTLDGPWRWHDAEGKLLSKPIPIYIEGHPERPVGSDETYWVGGPDPYTAFWLSEDSESAEA